MRAVTAFIAALLSLTVAAAEQVTIEPSAPKSGEPVTITIQSAWSDSCVPQLERVFMAGPGVFVATFRRPVDVGCLTVVTPYTRVIRLPGLAPGTYRIDSRLVDTIARPIFAPVIFTVSPEPSQKLLGEITPALGGASGGGVVHLLCPIANCTGARVLFGGAANDVPPHEATHVEVGTNGVLAAVPPFSSVTNMGLVDVTLRVGGDEWVRPGAFQYVFRQEYETILLPALTNDVIPGAYGSQWKIDHTVYNGNAIDLQPYTDYMHFLYVCLILCPNTSTIPAGKAVPVPMMNGTSRPPNWIMHVRREVADALTFSLRVRDLSRQSETWGTEIPVVREARFKPAVQLLDVPLQERFRQTLRIFALPSPTCCGPVRVRFYSMESGVLLYETTAQLQLPASATDIPGSPDFPVQPEGAEVDQLNTIPELAGTSSVRIEVDAISRKIWAYVGVTNNATQHVTIVSPQ